MFVHWVTQFEILTKLMYRFNVIQQLIFIEIDKLILKFTCKYEGPKQRIIILFLIYLMFGTKQFLKR